MTRWAWAEVSAAAIEHNVRVLAQDVTSAWPVQVWAVVKANGYGHGALTAAHAALAGGASGLCVALVQEAAQLRAAGVDAPILVLTEQPHEDLADAVALGLRLSVYRPEYLAAIEAAGGRGVPVHLKLDTGMQRVGAQPGDAVAMADAIAASSATVLEGVFTHLAAADEPEHPSNREQLDRFDAALDALSAAGHRPTLVHAANSAGAIVHPRARYSMVRPGIAVYGISPGPEVDGMVAELGLQPALSLRAKVSFVKRVSAGSRISYGLRHTFSRDTTVATVPIGYADGVPRRLFSMGGEVLLGGVRRRIVGVVTMDQLMVDCGDDHVEVGDEVVLIGRQGPHHVTASEWGERLGTIGYEVVCAISSRVERRPV
jgi:alanine racemase